MFIPYADNLLHKQVIARRTDVIVYTGVNDRFHPQDLLGKQFNFSDDPMWKMVRTLEERTTQDIQFDSPQKAQFVALFHTSDFVNIAEVQVFSTPGKRPHRFLQFAIHVTILQYII